MAKGYRQSTVLGKYPVTNWRLPTTYEPDQPVYADEASYQASRWPQSGESVPGQNVVYGSSPTEQAIGQNAPVGEVPTVEGVEVDGGLNMKQLRDFANLVYPDGEKPTMEYGSDVNVRIPFTKRSLFKMSGKKMDKLAGALAAAAQGAYVPGSDPGGQFLKGFLQGYGGVRSQGYAERKKEFETKQAAFKANAEARSKLIGQLGLEGYKAMMKPANAGSEAYVTLTQDMVDDLYKRTGKVIAQGLVGKTVPKSMLTGKPTPADSGAEGVQVQRDKMNVDAAKDWRNSDFYKAHQGLSRATASILALSKNPKNMSDQAIVYFINKVLDSNSAVLQGEQKAWSGGSNFIEGLKGTVSKWRGVGKFSDDDRAEIVEIARQLHETSKKLFDAERAQNIATNQQFGISPSAFQGIDYTPRDYRDYESFNPNRTTVGQSLDADLKNQNPPRKKVFGIF